MMAVLVYDNRHINLETQEDHPHFENMVHRFLDGNIVVVTLVVALEENTVRVGVVLVVMH